MIDYKVYNQTAKEVKTIKLDPAIFAVPIKKGVVKEVADIMSANSRQVLADTKGRSEVRGGGRKPWKQKGTGRARHGSSRSPLWKGGGVTFGPTSERNFTKKVNSKMKKLALQMILSNKVANERLIIIDKLDFTDAKTNTLNSIIKTILGNKRKAVLALDNRDEKIIRAAKNIPALATLPATSLNVLDLLKYPNLIVTEKAIEIINKLYK